MRMSIGYTDERGRGLGHFFRLLLIFFIITAGVFVVINIKVRPFIISVAKGYAVNEVSNTLNQIVDEILKDDNYTFINLIEDGDGRVAAATMNTADVNLFMTKISIGLKNKIADMDKIEAQIPLGNFCPYPLFSGLGPKIRVKFLILSNTNITAKENFVAKGINQTLYTVNFHVVTDVGIYIPAMHSSVTVENDIPVSQTLIIGTVPQSYTNVEGLDSSAQDAVMNID